MRCALLLSMSLVVAYAAEPSVLDLGVGQGGDFYLKLLADDTLALPIRLESMRRAMYDPETPIEALHETVVDLKDRHVRGAGVELFIKCYPDQKVPLLVALLEAAEDKRERRRVAEDLLPVCPPAQREAVLTSLFADCRVKDLVEWQSIILSWDNAQELLTAAMPTGRRAEDERFIVESWLKWVSEPAERRAFLEQLPWDQIGAYDLYRARFGFAGIPELRASLLTAKNSLHSSRIIEALAALGDTESIPLFERIARNDPEAETRGAAIDALNALGAPLPLDELLVVAKDRTAGSKQSINIAGIRIHRIPYPLAEAAIRGIGYHKGPEPFKTLVDMALNHDDEGTAIIEAICEALGTYGDPKAFDLVRQVQQKLDEAQLRGASEVVGKALSALAAQRGKTILHHDQIQVYDITYKGPKNTVRLITDRPLMAAKNPSIVRKLWMNGYQIDQQVWTVTPEKWAEFVQAWSKPGADFRVPLKGKDVVFDMVDAGGTFLVRND